jgi:hypothetical protein
VHVLSLLSYIGSRYLSHLYCRSFAVYEDMFRDILIGPLSSDSDNENRITISSLTLRQCQVTRHIIVCRPRHDHPTWAWPRARYLEETRLFTGVKTGGSARARPPSYTLKTSHQTTQSAYFEQSLCSIIHQLSLDYITLFLLSKKNFNVVAWLFPPTGRIGLFLLR